MRDSKPPLPPTGAPVPPSGIPTPPAQAGLAQPGSAPHSGPAGQGMPASQGTSAFQPASATGRTAGSPNGRKPGSSTGPKVAIIVGVVVVVALVVVAAVFLLRGGLPGGAPAPSPTTEGSQASTTSSSSTGSSATDSAATGSGSQDSDVIIAERLDTSSKFTAKDLGAFAGQDPTTGEGIVVMLVDFTNGSDQPASFRDTMSAKATQAGAQLSETYISGLSDLVSTPVAAGQTQTVVIIWKAQNGSDPVSIDITDNSGYSTQPIYSKTYTVDELLANAQSLSDEINGMQGGQGGQGGEGLKDDLDSLDAQTGLSA